MLRLRRKCAPSPTRIGEAHERQERPLSADWNCEDGFRVENGGCQPASQPGVESGRDLDLICRAQERDTQIDDLLVAGAPATERHVGDETPPHHRVVDRLVSKIGVPK